MNTYMFICGLSCNEEIENVSENNHIYVIKTWYYIYIYIKELL